MSHRSISQNLDNFIKNMQTFSHYMYCNIYKKSISKIFMKLSRFLAYMRSEIFTTFLEFSISVLKKVSGLKNMVRIYKFIWWPFRRMCHPRSWLQSNIYRNLVNSHSSRPIIFKVYFSFKNLNASFWTKVINDFK